MQIVILWSTKTADGPRCCSPISIEESRERPRLAAQRHAGGGRDRMANMESVSRNYIREVEMIFEQRLAKMG
jgi:hypothetical protein